MGWSLNSNNGLHYHYHGRIFMSLFKVAMQCSIGNAMFYFIIQFENANWIAFSFSTSTCIIQVNIKIKMQLCGLQFHFQETFMDWTFNCNSGLHYHYHGRIFMSLFKVAMQCSIGNAMFYFIIQFENANWIAFSISTSTCIIPVNIKIKCYCVVCHFIFMFQCLHFH